MEVEKGQGQTEPGPLNGEPVKLCANCGSIQHSARQLALVSLQGGLVSTPHVVPHRPGAHNPHPAHQSEQHGSVEDVVVVGGGGAVPSNSHAAPWWLSSHAHAPPPSALQGCLLYTSPSPRD